MGEPTELNFSLFSTRENEIFTEEFQVQLDKSGLPDVLDDTKLDVIFAVSEISRDFSIMLDDLQRLETNTFCCKISYNF